MNTKTVGELSEAKILVELLSLKYPVLIPWGDNQRYDFVIEKGGQFFRIQCKTGKYKKGCIVFPTRSLTSRNGQVVKIPYTNQIDYFAVYAPMTNKVYCIHISECGIDQCGLRLDVAKNNQVGNIKYAEDYEIHKILLGP